MKIAIATDDCKTISSHFGQAEKYVVITIEEGCIIFREIRAKANQQGFKREGLDGNHRHRDDPRGRGYGRRSEENHKRMFKAIDDCQVVLARGMGNGAYHGFHQMDIQPILTDIRDIKLAVQAVVDGSIKDHPERLH